MAPRTMARLGVARLNAFRLGYAQPWIKVYVDGVEQTDNAEINGCTITHLLNHEPDTCRFRVHGFTPSHGEEVKVYCGDEDLTHQLFGGHILNAQIGYHQKSDGTHEVFYDLDCVDYTWLLNRRKVIKKYTSESATAIVQDLISTYTSGFTTTNVALGLATIDEITFTNEDVTDAITRVMERVGGYWFADYAKDIHAFTTAEEAAGTVANATPRGANDIRRSIDLSQVATRVIVRGGGSAASTDADVGQATLPVDDPSWYAASGGTVECGPQRIAYTGVEVGGEGSTTGYVTPPNAASFYGATGGALTATATYLLAWTVTTDEGESTIGATQSLTLGALETQIQLDQVHIPIPTDPKISDKNLYMSDPNGAVGTLQLHATYARTFTTAVIVINAEAAGAAAPTTNQAGFSSESTEAGATSLRVEDLSVFPSASWAIAPGDQVFRYTGRSASSGAGTLTGIPASGTGSLTAPVRAGTVKVAPHLTGVSGILYAIQRGEPVNIVVTRNDSAAQTALAALVGGDGIHEVFLSDGRWAEDECTARGDAELALSKDPLTTITLTSRDQMQNVGWALTVNTTTPTISSTVTIQSVTLTELGAGGVTGMVFPKRTVTASSRRFSFEDLLRQIKAA